MDHTGTSALVTAAVAVSAAVRWRARHRRSPAVRRWRPSVLPTTRAGALHVRRGGTAEPVVVLLHGLVATGDVFGAGFDPLADEATVVVPDLLGFGRSLDESRNHLGPGDHLDTLDDMLEDQRLDQRPLVIGAHSMGGAVAVRWARRRGAQVRRVVCWGPPVYPSGAAVSAELRDSGFMTRLFAANTTWARLACRVNCAHRTLAGWLAAGLTPDLPVPIARAASLHTWPAYRDAMDQLVAGTDWGNCIEAATGAGTAVELTWGQDDRIGDRNHAGTLGGAAITVVPGAGHHLPLTHAELCRAQLRTG